MRAGPFFVLPHFLVPGQTYRGEESRADITIGMGFAGSDAGTLHIKGIGYFSPDIVTFYGVDQNGTKTQLVQHVSQLNVMLKAMPKIHDKAERIGFRMRARLEEDGNPGDGRGDGQNG